MSAYDKITERFLEALKNGTVPWHKPWRLVNRAYARKTGKPFSMLNQMVLLRGGEYATMRQWNADGYCVRKGEHPEWIFTWFYKDKEIVDRDGNKSTRREWFPKMVAQFHISQIEGEPTPRKGTNPEPVEKEPISALEDVIAGYLARETSLTFRPTMSNEAFYAPLLDLVQVPERNQFEETTEYYSTVFHELGHSTGHPDRLDRFKKGTAPSKFGSKDYSKEELVAELTAAFCLNRAGCETERTFENSAAYLNGWIAALENDHRMIVNAASAAEKATNFIWDVPKM